MAKADFTIDGSEAARQIAEAFTEGIAQLEAAGKRLGLEPIAVNIETGGKAAPYALHFGNVRNGDMVDITEAMQSAVDSGEPLDLSRGLVGAWPFGANGTTADLPPSGWHARVDNEWVPMEPVEPTPPQKEAAALEAEFRHQAEAMGFHARISCEVGMFSPDGRPDYKPILLVIDTGDLRDTSAVNFTGDIRGVRSTKAIGRILDAIATCEREILAARDDCDREGFSAGEAI